MKYLVLYILFVVYSLPIAAQDLEFSQFYSNPLYLNPSFSGTTDTHRFISNHRNQWPAAGNGFVSYSFSYDYMLPDVKSGIGFLVVADKAGTAGLKSTVANLQYSYKLLLANKLVISPGLSFGLGFRSIDMNKLIFADQLDFDNGLSGAPSDDPMSLQISSSSYFDFGSSILIYNKKVWVGGSVSHINRPNRSLTSNEAVIPVKTNIHGGLSFSVRATRRNPNPLVIMPSFNYVKQAQFDQLNVGSHFVYQSVKAGLWYRGIPISQAGRDNTSRDAAIVMLGFQLHDLELMYSYDITISSIGPNTGGAHEFSLQYNLRRTTKTRKKQKLIPCPVFYNKRDLNMERLKH